MRCVVNDLLKLFKWRTMASSANELESKYVRDVYREIAPHFSDTRHKPWPKVAEFLSRLPCGSLVADIGMWLVFMNLCNQIHRLWEW